MTAKIKVYIYILPFPPSIRHCKNMLGVLLQKDTFCHCATAGLLFTLEGGTFLYPCKPVGGVLPPVKVA